jgi:hypothetical protein
VFLIPLYRGTDTSANIRTFFANVFFREQHGMRLFENRVLKMVFGLKRVEIRRELRKTT